MKIPFDIKYRPQIESGEYKVVTCDGFPARIICWDSPIDKDRPIICIVFDDQIEQYKVDGRFDYHETTNYDLFIITPEPELSEFEKAFLERVFHQKAEDLDEENRENFREDARCVLELARKQLQQEIRAEALKDLPRWRKWESGTCGNSDGHPIALVSGAGGIRFVSVLCATGEKYIILDDLKKLPGFNE